MSHLSKTLLLSAGLLSMLALTACAGAAPANVQQDALSRTLSPCPDSPNCVSTQTPVTDTEHFIEPIPFMGSAADARQKLLAVIAAMPRTEIVTDEETYIHATFASQIFRFVDDVQFVIDDAAKTIHFRSASRMGRSDMGVNRKRMEEIRMSFTQAAVP